MRVLDLPAGFSGRVRDAGSSPAGMTLYRRPRATYPDPTDSPARIIGDVRDILLNDGWDMMIATPMHIPWPAPGCIGTNGCRVGRR